MLFGGELCSPDARKKLVNVIGGNASNGYMDAESCNESMKSKAKAKQKHP